MASFSSLPVYPLWMISFPPCLLENQSTYGMPLKVLNPPLTHILGGGIPIGTVLLIREDRRTAYAHLLLKYFLAQGIASGHGVAVASKDERPADIVRDLMWVVEDGDKDDGGEDTKKTAALNDEEDKLTIAWRYRNLKKFETGVESRAAPPSLQSKQSAAAALLSTTPTPQSQTQPAPFCHTYDLTKRIPASAIDTASVSLIEIPNEFDEEYIKGQDDYALLLERIRAVVEEGGFSSLTPTPPSGERNALRIGIHAIASPSWQIRNSHDLFRFFHALRGLLRFSFAAAVITIPAYLYVGEDATAGHIRRVEHMCDAVVEVESFASSPTASSASYAHNYHGLFRVYKLPALNSLLPSSTKLSVLSAGGSNDLAFRLRRKRFAIETFHLPPEGGVGERRTAPPQQEKAAEKAPRRIGSGEVRVGKGSGKGKKDPLEF
ncbi:Elongator complex protein 4 [Endogone sp. FLAS-F59071]|nr:Elongator complex protein 4 [Endogone sp. FLAS-F59071]|eukprot:RUS21564.1 Elongator complex protein 4 [Endogone sp. FLAS-F59071]